MYASDGTNGQRVLVDGRNFYATALQWIERAARSAPVKKDENAIPENGEDSRTRIRSRGRDSCVCDLLRSDRFLALYRRPGKFTRTVVPHWEPCSIDTTPSASSRDPKNRRPRGLRRTREARSERDRRPLPVVQRRPRRAQAGRGSDASHELASVPCVDTKATWSALTRHCLTTLVS
jgi:hypothetical protein